MKRIACTLVTALTLFSAVVAHAQRVEEEVVTETDYTTVNPSATSYDSSYTSSSSVAVGNYALKVGPIGNFYIEDSRTELDPGIGGFIGFDYRFHQHFSAEVALSGVLQDGKGISAGDNNIILMGIPTFDIKYYFLGQSRWDPYALMGFGLWYMTEGSVNNGTQAFGIGANLGIGCDYYITERISIGLGATFRAIAFIESVGGSHNGSSLFPFSVNGNFGYHF